MLTRPDDLADDEVAAAVADGWSVHAAGVEHLPVGFGSHHWWVDDADGRRWFVSIDEVDAASRRRLVAALSTARALRDEGMDFVVAPVVTHDGQVVHVMGERFAVALYPYVEGVAGEWGRYATEADRLSVLDRVLVLHDAAEPTRRHALVDDFTIPCRDALDAAVVDTGPWDTGPYGEPFRRLLARAKSRIDDMLRRHDQLAEDARSRPERFVLTHGEPHPGNTIRTDTGVVLVDWDTVLLAPPERDLWLLDATAEGDLYELRWNLTDLALAVERFRRPHDENADTANVWQGVNAILDR